MSSQRSINEWLGGSGKLKERRERSAGKQTGKEQWEIKDLSQATIGGDTDSWSSFSGRGGKHDEDNKSEYQQSGG